MSSTTPYWHPATLAVDKLLEECEIRFLRRSGPGGQHRNKVETAVQVIHRPSQLQAEANERRSQAENRAVAMFRLRVNLALEIRGKLNGAYAPSRLWASRCQGGKIEVSETHGDFPALLAEVLDVLRANDSDPVAAARQLSTTPSQIVKFLKKESRAFALLNAWRQDRGLHRLQ
jgi:hypothetical protein